VEKNFDVHFHALYLLFVTFASLQIKGEGDRGGEQRREAKIIVGNFS